MSCLLTAWVMGKSRLPVPPARMMPLTRSPYRGNAAGPGRGGGSSLLGGGRPSGRERPQLGVARRALLHRGQQPLVAGLGERRRGAVLGGELELEVGRPGQGEIG